MSTILLTSGISWTAPFSCTGMQIECWGGGGAGSTNFNLTEGAGGGGGGAYAITTFNITVNTLYSIQIGAAGTAGTSPVNGGNTSFAAACNAVGGTSALYNRLTGGNGGLKGSCTPSGTAHSGGNGWTTTSSLAGGGGGGSGGSSSDGNSATSSTGATAVTDGGIGGNGGNSGGGAGFAPASGYGGGGGGAGHGEYAGGNGYQGKIVLTYFTLTFSGNGDTGGSAPASLHLGPAANYTLPSNSGSLVKTNYIFTGWNTTANGSGTPYATGSTFAMPSADTILYAQWMWSTNIWFKMI